MSDEQYTTRRIGDEAIAALQQRVTELERQQRYYLAVIKTIGAMCRIEGAPTFDGDVREFLKGNYDLSKLDEKGTAR